MPRPAGTDLPETQLEEPCQRLLDQARLLLPLDTLTVALIESVGYSGKVVFSWKSGPESGINPLEPSRLPLSHETPQMATLNLPIQGNYDILGSVLMSTSLPDGFSNHQARLATDIVKQFAIFLENIQLHQQVETASQEMELADRIARIINSAPTIDAVYPEFAEATRRIVDFDRISIYTIDQDTGVLTVKYLLGPTPAGRNIGDTAPLKDTTAGYVCQSGETVIRDSVCLDPRFSIDETLRLLGFKSVISIPMKLNGSVIGVLGLHSEQTQAFGVREQALLERLANLIAPAVENARLQTQMQTNEQRTRILSAVNHILESAGDLDTLFGSLVSNLCNEIDIDQALLSWIRSNGYEIDTLLSTPKTTSAVSRSSIGKFNDLFAYNLNIPLSCKNETIGSFQLARATGPFSTHDRELLQLIGNHIAPAVYNQGLHNLTMQQAYQLNQRGSQTTTSAEGDDHTIQPEQAKMDDLAHALYSPLTSIKGYTDTLLQTGHHWSEEANQEFLQTINQAADRLDHAIKVLLIPTTTKHREAEGRTRQTCVQDLFRQLELVLSTSACPIQVHFQCDLSLPKISIEPSVFDRVLGHLIDCSISASTAPASLLVLAQAGQDSGVVSLGFSRAPLLEGQPTSATNFSLDTDLRVIASQKLLREQGITLDIKRPEESLVLFRFAAPFSQTGA